MKKCNAIFTFCGKYKKINNYAKSLLQVADPYRFLEDPDSEETKKYVDEQNLISKPFLDGAEWQKINEKLTKLWAYEKYGVPSKHGKRYYYSKNTGLQNQK